jgi:hypothetical protein
MAATDSIPAVFAESAHLRFVFMAKFCSAEFELLRLLSLLLPFAVGFAVAGAFAVAFGFAVAVAVGFAVGFAVALY